MRSGLAVSRASCALLCQPCLPTALPRPRLALRNGLHSGSCANLANLANLWRMPPGDLTNLFEHGPQENPVSE